MQQLQLPAGLDDVDVGRRGEPGQCLDAGLAQGGDVEHHRREVGICDFGLALLAHAQLGGRCPQLVACAGRYATRASGALLGHVFAGAHGLEMAQSAGWVIHQLAVVAAVDYYAHAFDSNRSLGNGRGQHYLAVPRCRRGDGLILLLCTEIAIEGVHAGRAQIVAQELGAAHDVGLSWQEGKDVALVPPVGLAHDGGHCFGYLLWGDVDIGSHGLHRIYLATAAYRSCPYGLAYGLGVDGCRHDNNVEVGTQDALHVPGQAEGQVGRQAALVKLVEDHAIHAFERGVAGHAACEYALGHNLYPGLCRNLSFKSYLVAHGLAHRFSQHLGHAHGHLPGSNAPGLKHDDAPLRHGVEHGEWQQCRLACARRRHDYCCMMLVQGRIELDGDGCGRQ